MLPLMPTLAGTSSFETLEVLCSFLILLCFNFSFQCWLFSLFCDTCGGYKRCACENNNDEGFRSVHWENTAGIIILRVSIYCRVKELMGLNGTSGSHLVRTQAQSLKVEPGCLELLFSRALKIFRDRKCTAFLGRAIMLVVNHWL